MDLDVAVKKLVDLSAVKIKDLKTRRMFLLVDGERTLREIFEFCKFDLAQGCEMATSLLESSYISLGGSSPAPPGTSKLAVPQTVEGFTFMEEDIDLLISELGKYIGPISSLLVQKTVKPGQVFSSPDKGKLFDSYASKIEDPVKRKQFLSDIHADFK